MSNLKSAFEDIVLNALQEFGYKVETIEQVKNDKILKQFAIKMLQNSKYDDGVRPEDIKAIDDFLETF